MAIDLGIEGIGPAVLIGAGGSASVFAAERSGEDEHVAIKVLKSSAATAKEQARFATEQQTLTKLGEHAGIVPILGSGVTDRGEPYFLMPLMEASVQDHLDDHGPLTWEHMVAVLMGVADAVEFAHDNDVLHRDLKPGNVLIDEAFVPRVSDFGIAKLTDATSATSTSISGTPGYMPPEQFRGQPASELSDIYSLGATAASMVTGAIPFVTGQEDTREAVMLRVLNDAPPNLAETGDVPAEIADVISAAMAKDPADRPPSVRAFKRMLRTAAVAAGATTLDEQATVVVPHRVLDLAPPPTADGTTTPSGPSPWRLPAIAAALLAIAATAGLLLTNPDGSDLTAAGATSAEETQAETSEADEQATSTSHAPEETEAEADTTIAPAVEGTVEIASGIDADGDSTQTSDTASPATLPSPTTPTVAPTNAPTIAQPTLAPTTPPTVAPTTPTVAPTTPTVEPTTAPTSPPPESQSRFDTVTINAGGTASQGDFLRSAGATSVVHVSGDLRGSLNGGTYTHTRESQNAYSFTFGLEERNSLGQTLTEWTVTVTVASNGNADDGNCPAIQVQGLSARADSSEVMVLTWSTNTDGTERVTTTQSGGGSFGSRESGNYYTNFTHKLGDQTWTSTSPLTPGATYTSTVSVTSRCNPNDTTSTTITFTTPT